MNYKALMAGALTAGVGCVCIIISSIKKAVGDEHPILSLNRIYSIESIFFQRLFGASIKNSILKVHETLEKYLENAENENSEPGVKDVIIAAAKKNTLKDFMSEFYRQRDLLKLGLYILTTDEKEEKTKNAKKIDGPSNKSLESSLIISKEESKVLFEKFNLPKSVTIFKVLELMVDGWKSFINLQEINGVDKTDTFLSIAIRLSISLMEVNSNIFKQLGNTVTAKDSHSLIELTNFISKKLLGRGTKEKKEWLTPITT